MSKRHSAIVFALEMVCCGLHASAEDRTVAPAKVDCLCVYYPHWHVYPKGNEWFHEGWTEWEYVKTAIPRFPGHRQPIVPLMGYLDGASPADVAREIDLAADAGIDAFLYDYYWYDGKVTQEESIERGFLRAPNKARMKFALMWCYHERRYAWRIRPDEKPRILMSLAHTEEEFLGLIDHAINRYFPCPEYYRKDGKLFFSIYDAPYFYLKRGSDPDKVRAQLERARAHVRSAGLGELHINGQGVDPHLADKLAKCGFDSFTHYNPDRWAVSRRNSEQGRDPLLLDYAEVMAENRVRWAKMSKAPLPYIPNVSTGWDSTPRCRLDEPYPWKEITYPYLWTVTNNTPEIFRRELAAARRFVETDPKRPGIVYVNGWNEYTEGTYLVPDNLNGRGFLDAVKSVFAEPSKTEGAMR